MITHRQDMFEDVIHDIEASHHRSKKVLLKLQLKPLNTLGNTSSLDGKHVPAQYVEFCRSCETEDAIEGDSGSSANQWKTSSQFTGTEYCPPAHPSADDYTLFKFYAVNETLVRNRQTMLYVA